MVATQIATNKLVNATMAAAIHASFGFLFQETIRRRSCVLARGANSRKDIFDPFLILRVFFEDDLGTLEVSERDVCDSPASADSSVEGSSYSDKMLVIGTFLVMRCFGPCVMDNQDLTHMGSPTLKEKLKIAL